MSVMLISLPTLFEFPLRTLNRTETCWIFVLSSLDTVVFICFLNLLLVFPQRKRVVVPAALKIVRLKPTRKVRTLRNTFLFTVQHDQELNMANWHERTQVQSYK